MEPECKIFVITLRDYPERLAAFQKQVDQWGLPYEIVYGTPGYKLGRLKQLAINLPRLLVLRPPLSPGMIGCCASHMRIFKRMLDEDMEYALILEDDACFTRPLTPELVKNFDPGDIPFDMFFLGHNEYDYRDFSLGAPLSFGSMKGQKIHGFMPYGTIGCIVHKRMAVKRMRQPFYLEEPVDHYWRYGALDAYIAAPRVLAPDLDLISVIQAKVRGNGSTQNIVIDRSTRVPRDASLGRRLSGFARSVIIGSGLALLLKRLQARCLDF